MRAVALATMTTICTHNGRQIEYRDGQWYYEDGSLAIYSVKLADGPPSCLVHAEDGLVHSHENGNPTVWRNERWEYEDGTPVENNPRPCPACGGLPTAEGEDACLGHIPGAMAACCGHGGVTEAFVNFDDPELTGLMRQMFG